MSTSQKSSRLEARITAEQKELIERAAGYLGKSGVHLRCAGAEGDPTMRHDMWTQTLIELKVTSSLAVAGRFILVTDTNHSDLGRVLDRKLLVMIKRCMSFLFLLLALSLSGGQAFAQDRQVLYSQSLSSNLEKIVKTIQDPNTEKISYADLSSQTDYFARIAPRKHTVTHSNDLQPTAILGTKPFIFLTNPESLYGRSLLDVYLDIGYETEDIIRWQRNEEMVAIVFRYPAAIQTTEGRDGKLPQNWDSHVYIPTWENIFSLFHTLASTALIDPNKEGEFAPEKSFFRSKEEQAFVLGFPEAGKKRLQTTAYASLKGRGGEDWAYRDVLEKKLSIFEHFRGNGRTLNEIVDPDGVQREAGLFEFVGPNMKIKSLPEVAIIYLGKLSIETTYTSSQ